MEVVICYKCMYFFGLIVGIYDYYGFAFVGTNCHCIFRYKLMVQVLYNIFLSLLYGVVVVV